MHCDLKPENILIEGPNSSSVKIIDLGLSEIVDKSSSLRSERGSIYYLAPEMILKNYNYKVDIWAAGVIFYVLVTGKPPFNAVQRDVTGAKRLDQDKIKKLILKGQVDYSLPVFQNEGRCLKEIIQQMLKQNPDQRPEAKELLKHPFFLKKLDVKISDQGAWLRPLTQEMKTIFKNLVTLNHGSQLRKGIAMYFANYFSLREEKRRLYKYFSQIDKDRNGMITFNELIEAFSFQVG